MNQRMLPVTLLLLAAVQCLTEAQTPLDGSVVEMRRTIGDAAIELVGVYVDGYPKYISFLRVVTKNKEFTSVSYNIETQVHSQTDSSGRRQEWGYLQRSPDDSSLHTIPDHEQETKRFTHITVTGSLEHGERTDKSLTKLTDIILNDSRNVVGSWLVSFSSPLPPSNTQRVISRLKRPLRFGDPAKANKSLSGARLFQIERGYGIRYVP